MLSFEECVSCLETVRDFCYSHSCEECLLHHICFTDLISEPAQWNLERR